MPGAQCTRSLVCAYGVKYAHEYSQRRHRKHPAFPTQWFYGLLRALPGAPGFLATVTCATRTRRSKLDISVGMPGPHGCAVHIRRTRPFCAIRVHRSPPHVRDDRETPLLVRRDDSLYSCFYVAVKFISEIQKFSEAVGDALKRGLFQREASTSASLVWAMLAISGVRTH